jgi:hypothetical protein
MKKSRCALWARKCGISTSGIQKNSIQTPSKICFRHKSIHNSDAIYNTLEGKNVIIYLHIQEFTYGMHKIVRRCNLEEEEGRRTRKEVIFVSAIAAAVTHEVVMITLKNIERNFTV